MILHVAHCISHSSFATFLWPVPAIPHFLWPVSAIPHCRSLMPMLRSDICASLSASERQLNVAADMLDSIGEKLDALMDVYSDHEVNDWYVRKGAAMARTLEHHLDIWVTQANVLLEALDEVWASDAHVEPDSAEPDEEESPVSQDPRGADAQTSGCVTEDAASDTEFAEDYPPQHPPQANVEREEPTTPSTPPLAIAVALAESANVHDDAARAPSMSPRGMTPSPSSVATELDIAEDLSGSETPRLLATSTGHSDNASVEASVISKRRKRQHEAMEATAGEAAIDGHEVAGG